MEKIEWSPENDSSIKEKEFQIHEEYHKSLVQKYKNESQVFSSFRSFRIRCLEYANSEIGPIKGDVLEIGAGDGWCSAYMLKNYQINSMYTMEITKAAINELIPHVYSLCGVNTDNTTLIRGSFNQIDYDSKFDFIIGMGAIHHSENLQLTFDNIYKALKPGGVFIAQEPAMIDETQNDFYNNRNQQETVFKKLFKVKNEERSDIFYRRCEYLTAAYHSGFNLKIKWLFPSNRGFKRVFGIDPKLNTDKANNLLIMAKKPLDSVDANSVSRWG